MSNGCGDRRCSGLWNGQARCVAGVLEVRPLCDEIATEAWHGNEGDVQVRYSS